MAAHIARANAQQFDYADLMRQLQERQAAWDAATGMARRFEVEGGSIWQNPGDPFYDQAVDPREDRNSFDNGQTGYYYNPTTQTFRVSQGDSTSGIQRWDVTPNGTTNLGFEDIDRNGKYNRGLGKMAAITGAVLGAGALAEAWAAGSGLSTGAQGAFVASSEQMAANAAWSSGGAAEVAGGAGASALESGGLLGAAGPYDAVSFSGLGMDTAGLDSLISQQSAMYPGIMDASAAANGSWDVLPAATQPAMQGAGTAAGTTAAQQAMNQRNSQQNTQQSMLERLMSGGLQGLTGQDIGGLLGGLLGARNQYNFGQALLDRAAEATPNRGFYEGQLRQTYENPGAYLQSPEYQAAQDIVHNKLQRSDAAGGRLANDIGRQTTLQNHALSSLGQYRQGLSGIVGQNQNAFTGANSMYTAGQAANNSWSNGILYPLLQQGK